VDTGAFIGRHFARDQHHDAAVRGWRRARGERLLTSTLVLSETFTLLARWAGGPFASARARSILESEGLEILRPTLDHEREAAELLETYADQAVSFTDCISFVLMRHRRIRRAFAFDRHFQSAGFDRWP